LQRLKRWFSNFKHYNEFGVNYKFLRVSLSAGPQNKAMLEMVHEAMLEALQAPALIELNVIDSYVTRVSRQVK
jgi:hypothetical protein